MISVTRENNVVYVKVQITQLGGWFPFAYRCDQEWSAKALEWFLRDVLFGRIRAVREEEYRAGLKDGRKKKDERRDWFDGSLDLGNKK